MATMEFKATFNARGFVPGVDISEMEWQMIISEFLAMQNLYADMCNQILDRLNETWEKYESIKKMDDIMGNCVSTYMTQMTMGIDENTSYGDWIEKWEKDICKAVDATAELAGFRIRSNLFRDDDLPVFGAKFKDRPEWKIDLTLEPVG